MRLLYALQFWHSRETEKSIALSNANKVKALQSEYVRGFVFTIGPDEGDKCLRRLQFEIKRGVQSKTLGDEPYREVLCLARDVSVLWKDR
jgi:hypothetical protein